MRLSGAFKLFGFTFLLIFLAGTVSFGQNTKGDKPVNRESRFKTPFKKNKQKRKPSSAKRVRAKDYSVAGRASSPSPRRRASGKDRPGQPIRPIARTEPQTKQKAWKGDIAGYRIRKRSSAGSSRNVYPQYGRYSNNNARLPKPESQPVSNKTALARVRKLQSQPTPPGRKQKIVPRSGSRSFTARRSTNIYASFPRPKKRGERARTTDLAGRPLRSKNFESPRPGVSVPIFKPYAGRGKMGDKPYRGQTMGGYRSATRTTPRAWTGDIAGRRIRGRNFTSKRSVEGTPILAGRGKNSKSRPGNDPVAPRGPGIGINGIGGFRGRIKSGRPLKGGGSVSGKVWNNGERSLNEYAVKRSGRETRFQGNVRGGKPLKGGGSVSGRVWNNNQRSLNEYATKKSGREARFQGNIKGGKPIKGGGSVSGRVWNNNESSLKEYALKKSGREATFQGNVKAGHPFKGGGSASGKLWNNKQQPIQGPTFPSQAARVNGYSPKTQRFAQQPGFLDQGGRFTGYIKLKKFRKNYDHAPKSVEESAQQRTPKKNAYKAEGLQVKVKRRDYIENEKTSDEALKKLEPTKSTTDAGGLQVRVKRPDYIRNKNSHEDALLKLRPSKTTAQAGELQVKRKQAEYGRKPNAAEGSMPGIKPTKTSIKASEYARSVRRNFDYIHNPSSSDEALKTREPGKAFARVSAYQGNVKMQKFALFEQNRKSHPDTKFIKINKNNVDEERDAMTNFKLWWSRLFKKQETQPDHLKFKGGKPRYDKGEAGMWND